MSDLFAGLEFETDKPARMYLIHPGTGSPIVERDDAGAVVLEEASGQPSMAYIAFHSAESPRGVEFARKADLARLGLRKEITDAEKLKRFEAEQIERLVALADHWHLLTFEGRPMDVPFNTENVRKFFTNPRALEWRRQGNVFVVNVANFMRASSATSPLLLSLDSVST